MQIGTGREHLVARPDHQTLVAGLGQFNALQQSFNHTRTDGVHLGLDAGNQYFVIQCPQADGFILMQGLAGGLRRGRVGSQHAFREVLARVDWQAAWQDKLAAAGVPGALFGMDTSSVSHRPLKDPFRQRRFAQGLACVNVFLDHVGNHQPAGFLPQLERALLHAKAPAHAVVHVTRVVGNRRQMHCAIVKAVAQNGPQELTLRALAVAQQLQALCRRLFQHAGVHLVSLLTGRYVLTRLQLEAHHIAPDLFEKTCLGLLPQIAHFEQSLEHLRGGKTLIERIDFKAEGVLQGLDDMGHGVEPHHVGSAERAGTGATQLLACEVIHHVVAKAKIGHFLHGGEHAGNANAVGNEIGRVLGTHHAFAQNAGNKGFQIVQNFRLGGRRVDQFHQHHVTWRIEEMDATKTWLDFLRQGFTQLRDRQAGGIGCNDGVRRQKGGDFLVKIEFPVHALGNRFDHQIAVLQQFQVFLVIGLADQGSVGRDPQRRGFELFQTLDGVADDAVFGTLSGRQVKQDDRHLDVDQVRCNLRPHHAGTQHGNFTDLESSHKILLTVFLTPPRTSPGSVSFDAMPDLGAVEEPDIATHLHRLATINRLQSGLVGFAIVGVEDLATTPQRFVVCILVHVANNRHAQNRLVLALVAALVALGVELGCVKDFFHHTSQHAAFFCDANQ